MSYREKINCIVSGCARRELVIGSCEPRTASVNRLNQPASDKLHELDTILYCCYQFNKPLHPIHEINKASPKSTTQVRPHSLIQSCSLITRSIQPTFGRVFPFITQQ